MLKLDKVNAYYGELQALYDVSLEIREGEIIAILGANAAGKSTTLKVISGIINGVNGEITWNGANLLKIPAHERVDLGIVQVPEGRQLFPFMSVQENLEIGSYTAKARSSRKDTLKMVYEMLPILYDRRNQMAGSLSGGEQQMCAIARGLMAKPKLMMLDEPSLGLAPIMVQTIFRLIKDIREQGVTIILVEQNLKLSLQIADRAYILENGHMVLSGCAGELQENPRVKKAYLGM